MSETRVTFAQLPSELRVQIFAACVQNRSIGLLLAKKKLYAEFIPQLREKFTLNLWIDPARSPSRIVILNDFGESWGRHKHEIPLEGFHLPVSRNPLHSMPLHEFRKIVLWIDAPNFLDPGQLIRANKLTSALVTLISPSWCLSSQLPESMDDIVFATSSERQRLPPMEIILRNASCRKWCSSQQWHRSLPGIESGCDHDIRQLSFDRSTFDELDNGLDGDVDIALQPFSRLRNVASLKIVLPQPHPEKKLLSTILHDIEDSAISTIPFGLHCNVLKNDGDLVDLEFDSVRFLWLDFLLDNAPGPAADLLRFERFKKWCPRYESTLHQSFYGFNTTKRPVIGAGKAIADWVLRDVWKKMCASYHSRFWAFIDFRDNPDPHWKLTVERKSSNPDWHDFNDMPLAFFTSKRALTTSCSHCLKGPSDPASKCVGSRGFAGPKEVYPDDSAWQSSTNRSPAVS